MFSNAYQNGPTLQVWDAKVNIDKNIFYKQLFRVNPNSNHKDFDKQAKSYLFYLNGQNTKMTLPAEDTKILALHQRYLVLHIFITIGYPWSLELGMTDISGIKRRVNITTAQGKQQVKYFSFRYPIDNLQKGVWLFLAIDIFSFMDAFKGQTFRSLDQITIGSTCRLRRIFTMKQFVEWEIPKNYWLSQQIPQQFQLIQYKQSTKLGCQFSKQLTESIQTPKKIEQSNVSLKNSINIKQIEIKRNSINQSKIIIDKKINSKMAKSEVIITNAQNKLQMLQKRQENLRQKSKQLEPKSISKIAKQRHGNMDKNKSANLGVKSKQLQKQQRQDKQQKQRQKNSIKPMKSKSPKIEKSFQEDTALNNQYQESSNFTEQHMKPLSPKTPFGFSSKQQIIQQDQWSDEERLESRPISEAISNMTGDFPSTIITKQNNKEVVISKHNKKELELIYDQMVGCYYHPQTNSYFELKN